MAETQPAESPHPARPVRADVARNRAAIVTAARAAFARGEFDRRFDDFAGLAGVGVGTLYRHFPTRDALAEAVYHEEVAALCDRARLLLDEVPPAQALAAFLREFVALLDEQPGLARTLGTLMQHRSELQAHGGRALQAAVTELVAAAIQDKAVNTDLTPGVVMTALHGIGSTFGSLEWRDNAEKLIAVLVGPQTALSTEKEPRPPRP